MDCRSDCGGRGSPRQRKPQSVSHTAACMPMYTGECFVFCNCVYVYLCILQYPSQFPTHISMHPHVHWKMFCTVYLCIHVFCILHLAVSIKYFVFCNFVFAFVFCICTGLFFIPLYSVFVFCNALVSFPHGISH